MGSGLCGAEPPDETEFKDRQPAASMILRDLLCCPPAWACHQPSPHFTPPKTLAEPRMKREVSPYIYAIKKHQQLQLT